MLVSDDDSISERVRIISLHGISRDAWNRYAASGSWYYEIEDADYKYNMTDIAAALGLVQLERAEELLASRRSIATAYPLLTECRDHCRPVKPQPFELEAKDVHHLHPFYRRRWNTRPKDDPAATREYERVISLPIWPGMSESDVRHVVATLASILDRARRS